jgi:uncharacterized protein YdeI (BOF family)
MKSILPILTVLLTATTAAFAADAEITLTGEGKCMKCALKKAEKCQNVLEVKKDDKITLYKLVGDVSTKFHGELCGENKKITVTGKVEKKGETPEFAVSKIELAK